VWAQLRQDAVKRFCRWGKSELGRRFDSNGSTTNGTAFEQRDVKKSEDSTEQRQETQLPKSRTPIER
jgi:hypothetical protein